MNPLRFLSGRACFVVFALSACAGVSPAATLASYQFANANVTSTASQVTGGAASWSLSNGNYGLGGSAGTAYATINGMTSAFDDTKYLTFTLTAANGYALNLSSFAFDLGGNSSTGAATTISAQLRTSAGTTPYATNVSLAPGSVTTATHSILSTDSSTRFTSYTADLSAPEYQGVAGITFRLHVAAANSSSTVFLRFDNVTVDGAVVSAVPEPSVVALLAGSAALGAVVVCRRRRAR